MQPNYRAYTGGIIDKLTEYDDYIVDPRVAELREKLYK